MDLSEIKETLRGLSPEERRELIAWLKGAAPQRTLPWSQWLAWFARQRRNWNRRITAALPGPMRAVAGTLIGLLLFACAEGAIFRSGWYSKYLEPNSMAGQVEYNLFWLRRTWPPKVPDVVVLGDSRMAEGFSARAANAAAGGKVHFTNLGISGTMPRVWYYTLRDADHDRNRFSAIVIPFDWYSDYDPPEEFQNRPNDFSFLSARLGWNECWDFSHTYIDPNLRHSILRDCLIRGLAMRPDVQAFLANISDRLKRTKDWRNNGPKYIYDYDGRPENLSGLSFDAATRKIHFPPGLTANQIGTVQAMLTPYIGPQTGDLTAYRRQWIGGILDLYKNSNTRFIFMRLPNAPLLMPEPATPARFIDSVKGQPRIAVLPAGTFQSLQKPEFFADGLHLNHSGRQLFSAALAKAVVPVVTEK